MHLIRYIKIFECQKQLFTKTAISLTFWTTICFIDEEHSQDSFRSSSEKKIQKFEL